MASGSTQNLSQGHNEALQALLNSISASSASPSSESGNKLSAEQAGKISSRLDELLGNDVAGQALAEASQVKRNEKGEILNEEGLPIIEISEPVEFSSEAVASTLLPEHDLPLNPAPPPPLTAEQKAEMERILDMLEAEESAEEARASLQAEQARKREVEARKENAKKDLERLKKAKEMQRKMGKALIRNVEEARERERKEKEERDREDERVERERKEGKPQGPKKKVSFAEMPTVHIKSPDTPQGTESTAPQDGSSEMWGEVYPARLKPAHAVTIGKQTMKLQVVERFPSATASSSRPRSVSPPPPSRPVTEADSDDESVPSSPIPADSDAGEPIVEDADPDHDAPIQPPSSGDEYDDLPEDEVLDDEYDFDSAQHQREIALEYYKKRSTIGEDTARALSAHTHEAVGPNGEPDDEWNQPEVPLEATLSSKQTYSSSRFKRSYNTTLPRSTPSQSLGASVLPSSTSTSSTSLPQVARAIRTGKLDENDKLVAPPWASDDEDVEDFGDEEENANARRWLDAMRRGEVENVGATMEERSDALVKALEAAYGAPKKSKDNADSDGDRTAVATPIVAGTASASVPPTATTVVSPSVETKPKTSKFRLARMPPRTASSLASATDSEAGTPTMTEGRSSPKMPTGPSIGIIERKATAPSALASTVVERNAKPAVGSTISSSVVERNPSVSSSSTITPPTQPQFPMVVDSPSFQAPIGSTSSTIVDSPSFSAPASAPSTSQAPTSMSMVVDSPSFMPPTGSRPSKPPAVMRSTVRESSGPKDTTTGSFNVGEGGAPKKVSRFRAERT